MSIVFNNKAVSRLKGVWNATTKVFDAVGASDTQIKIQDGDYRKFLASHSAGDFFYCLLRGPEYREVVRVQITGSSEADGLRVQRGREGTTARSWPRGTLLRQIVSAETLTALKQKHVPVYAGNPNDDLYANYPRQLVKDTTNDTWWSSLSELEFLISGGSMIDQGGGVVRVPLYSLDFDIGDYIKFSGLGDYTGTYPVVAVGADYVEFTATYVPATFDGSEYVFGPVQEWRLHAGTMTVADPTISPAAGTYENGQTVTLTCATPNAVIRYTLDGTDPTSESTIYTSAISLPDDSTTTLKAKAFFEAEGWTSSGVVSADLVLIAGVEELLNYGEWNDVTSDEFWTSNGFFAWDGSKWSTEVGNAGLEAGDWTLDYDSLVSKVRVTLSKASIFRLSVGARRNPPDGFVWATDHVSPYASEEEVTITYDTENGFIALSSLTFKGEEFGGSSYNVTKIEVFYG